MASNQAPARLSQPTPVAPAQLCGVASVHPWTADQPPASLPSPSPWGWKLSCQIAALGWP